MSRPDAWRTRKSRKRGFDDDNHEEPAWPSSAPPPSFAPTDRAPVQGGPEVQATVRWFNAEKGFGFVEVAGGGGDAFLHGSVLTRAGAASVNPGATLKVRLAPSQKGPQVTEVTEIRDAEAPAGGAAPAHSSGGGGGRPMAPAGDAQEMLGTVKWYNAEKGFGFVAPESGGKDVFMHATAIARGGATQVTDGTPVRMQVAQGKKGPEAVSVSNR